MDEDGGFSRFVKIIITLIFVAVIISLAIGISQRVYSRTKSVTNNSITQVSVNIIGGSCSGIGTTGRVYDFSSPQPGVPVNITVRVSPIGSPVSTLVIAKATVTLKAEDGSKVFEKTFSNIKGGVISFLHTFKSPGTYYVYVSATTNYGSVYNKPVGSITVGGSLLSGRVPVRKDLELKIPVGANVKFVNIIPDTEYETPVQGALNVYVPLAIYTQSSAELVSELVAKHVFVRLVEAGVPLLNALSTAKFVKAVVYKETTTGYSNGGFATVEPAVNVTEKPSKDFLPEYSLRLYLLGRVSYPALKVSIKYSGYVTGVDYDVETVKGHFEYPAVLSTYSVYLNDKRILDHSSSGTTTSASFIHLTKSTDDELDFSLTRPVTGELLIYYAMPYQTPGEAYAPVVVGNETIYTVGVPLDYSFTSLQNVKRIATLSITPGAVGNTITLYFTKKDFEGKTVEDAVEDKLSTVSSALNITDKTLLQKVLKAVKTKLKGGKLKYSTTVTPLLKLDHVESGMAYYKPVALLNYTVEAIKVDISFSSKSLFTDRETYPLSIPVSSVKASVIHFHAVKEVNLAPGDVSVSPSPVKVEDGLIALPVNVTDVGVSLKNGAVPDNLEIPSVALNGEAVTFENVAFKGGGKTTVSTHIPGEKVVSSSSVLPGGFVFELVRSKKVLSTNERFPDTVSYTTPSDAHLFGDYYLVSTSKKKRNNLVIVAGDIATDSSLYPVWVFTDVPETVSVYFPGTPKSVKITDINGDTLLEVVGGKIVNSSKAGVSIGGASLYDGVLSFTLTIMNSSVGELVITANGNNWTASTLITVHKAPYILNYQPVLGSLNFLKGNELALLVEPVYSVKTAPFGVLTVENLIPPNLTTYLSRIIKPSSSVLIPKTTERALASVSIGNGSVVFVGNIKNYTFVKENLPLGGFKDKMIHVFLIPLKTVKLSFYSNNAYVPNVTLTTHPAGLFAEYNTTVKTVYTFEGYVDRFKLYFEYTTKNGTGRAYVYAPNPGVAVETRDTSMLLNPSTYTVYRDGEYNVLKVSSFPLPVKSPTDVTVKVIVTTPLFAGEPVVGELTLEPASYMNNLLIVPKEYYIPYYAFNDLSVMNATVHDPGKGSLTLKLPDGALGYASNNFKVLAISDAPNELYFPYPSYDPFAEGVTSIGIPVPSGNTLMTPDELLKAVDEIDVTYTTDYITRTFTFKDVASFVKVLSDGGRDYGVIVIPLDPLVMSSVVDNPIDVSITLKLKNGGVYASNYLIQPVLSAYAPYTIYSKYAYILTVRVVQNRPRLYFSKVTGKVGDTVDFITKTVLHEADPLKKGYDALISHLKPFDTTDERWLFANSFNYEQLTIKPVLDGGYFPIDYPNEVYTFRTVYGYAVAFYIGGASELDFQMSYEPANYTLKDVVSLIKAGKLDPSYSKFFELKDGEYGVKLWFFIPSNGGIYAYVTVWKEGTERASEYFKVSGFGFSFVYRGHKFNVCWALLTNNEVKGLTVNVS